MGRNIIESAPPPVEVSLTEKFGEIFASGKIAKDLPVLQLEQKLKENSLSESELKELRIKLDEGLSLLEEKENQFQPNGLSPTTIREVRQSFAKRRSQIEKAIGLIQTKLNQFQYQQINQIATSENIDSQNLEEVISQVEQVDQQNPIEALRYFEKSFYEGFRDLSGDEQAQRMQILKSIHTQRLAKENAIMAEQNSQAIARNHYVDEYATKTPLKWGKLQPIFDIKENNLDFYKAKNDANNFDLNQRSKGDRGEANETAVANYISKTMPDVLCVIQTPRFSRADLLEIDLIVVRRNPTCSDLSDEFLMQGIEILKRQIQKYNDEVCKRIGMNHSRKYDVDYKSIVHTKDVGNQKLNSEKPFSQGDLSYYFDVQFVQVKNTDQGLKERKKSGDGVGGVCWKESSERDGTKEYFHDPEEFAKGVKLMLG